MSTGDSKFNSIAKLLGSERQALGLEAEWGHCLVAGVSSSYCKVGSVEVSKNDFFDVILVNYPLSYIFIDKLYKSVFSFSFCL